jgi:DNA-binding transcriptional regulator YhcF (GntR family)
MNSKIEIDITLKIPVYKQLIHNIELLINNGTYQPGDLLPSMNELASDLEISKETVQKAYTRLKEKGIIEPSHGKGFFIGENKNQKTKILVLFDKISTYKQVLYSSFLASIGTNAEITIRLHNQDIALFEEFIEENLDKFDYYLITPNFPLSQEIQKRVVKILKRIPNRKLLTLDRHITGLPGNYGSVYQDFEWDVYDGLKQGIESIRDYNKLNIIAMQGSLYAPLIQKGIKKFCNEFGIPFEIHYGINTNKIQSKEIYLILNSQLDFELIELVKAAKNRELKIGTDIGIISYNESPINEIVLDGLTVVSTDFKQMGELAAQMILDKTMKKVKCDFRLIRRSTF